MADEDQPRGTGGRGFAASAIDSEETAAFSKLVGVKARIEKFRLEQVEQAFSKLMQNKVRFRAVLVP